MSLIKEFYKVMKYLVQIDKCVIDIKFKSTCVLFTLKEEQKISIWAIID